MLQIVTIRRKTLKQFQKIFYLVAFLSYLSACSSTTNTVDKEIPTPKTNHTLQIESQKGRIDVETAIARSLKYNIDAIKTQIQPKFIGEEARTNASTNLLKLREDKTLSLGTSLKELDFAILYTITNIETHPDNINSYLTQMATQNITLAAIKSHKSAMFANKKISKIHQTIRQYQKQIRNLAKKQPNNSIAYQKDLENSIYKLNTLSEQLDQNIKDFTQLTKIDTHKIGFDSNGFYNNTILTAQSNPEPYVRNALQQRIETINFPSLSFEEIQQDVSKNQPITTANIKGIHINDTDYYQSLIKQSDEQATLLLQTTLAYQKASKRKKQKIIPVLQKELHKSIYLQTTLAYELAKKTSLDYEAQKDFTKKLSQQIQELRKISKLTPQQHAELLQKNIELIENEIIEDQILAERTMAVIALKIYSGQAYIPTGLLEKNIKQISNYIKQSLGKNLPILKSNTTNLETPPVNLDYLPEEPDNWAHKENWLEDLMKETKTNIKKNTNKISKPKTKIQLGSFIDKNTAIEEWKKLSTKYTELSKYQPNYELATIAGIKFYRLIIKSPQGDFNNLCAKLRQQNVECLLQE